ncbi:MAG TPA: histidinol-phosphate transaminase [Acidimicrobiales bacterium]|nr:histidinol-phosphate transaminase [Acidimicrobiales bacterium]
MTLPEPRPGLRLREGYHSPQVEVKVRLNTNESPYPPPASWVESVAEEARGIAFHRYPDRGVTGLRARLAALHGVEPANVLAANGSNEVLQLLLLAYGGHGRRALVFEPTYALHSHIARITGTDVVTVERTPGFTIDPTAAAAVEQHRPAVTFVCSPNNPTGLAEEPGTVRDLVDGTPGLVVVDEAYGQFARWSAVELVDDDRPLVVVRTFSKTWSMAALRLGYLIAPAAVVADLEHVTLPYHLDAVKQAAGTLALDFRAEMDGRVEAITTERRRLVDGLEGLDVDVWPSDANFVLFRPRRRDGAEVWASLVERSVLVRDCSSWPGLEGCLRVTIGTPEEDDLFLAALTEVLA